MSQAQTEILLTGFPATQLARAVLVELLRCHPHAHVTCIVPGKFLARAGAWLNERAAESRERVTLLEGDVTHMDFGLSGKRWLELSDKTQIIQHCAAVTYGAAPRRMPEAVNIQGAAEVLELARAARRIERVVHWSSTSATGPDEGVVFEHDLLEPSSAGVIERSRFRAEVLMRKAQKQLPITVLRPAPLVGDSVTGEIDRLDGPYLLITTMMSSPREVALPLPGRADVPLAMVPVDYAARAGVQLGTLTETEGRTLHIVDPRPVTLDEAACTFANLLDRLPPRRESAGRVARALLAVPGMSRLAPSHGAFVMELARHVRYDTQATSGLLEPLNLVCPSFEQYADVMVQAALKKRHGAAGPRSFQSEPSAARAPSATSQPESSR